MTTAAIEAYCNERWGTTQARVIGDRICGNRTASAVIDDCGNFMPLTWKPGDGYQPVDCPPMCGCLPGEGDCNDCPIRDILDTKGKLQ